MNILLTNDDGYFSSGISALKEELSKFHNVYLCAPIREKSASSHSITLFKKMELLEINKNEYAIDGTPADCVKVALLYLFKDINFDILISGINNGPNMGEDIFYSGTVAGAREGLLNNIFSIAASVDKWNKNKSFELPAKFLAELIEKLNKKLLSENILLNINFPDNSKPKGIKITHLGKRVYKDSIIFEKIDGKSYVTIGGDNPGFEYEENSDLSAVYENFVSITPITNDVYDRTIFNHLIYLEQEEWKVLKS